MVTLRSVKVVVNAQNAVLRVSRSYVCLVVVWKILHAASAVSVNRIHRSIVHQGPFNHLVGSVWSVVAKRRPKSCLNNHWNECQRSARWKVQYQVIRQQQHQESVPCVWINSFAVEKQTKSRAPAILMKKVENVAVSHVEKRRKKRMHGLIIVVRASWVNRRNSKSQ